jgi:hypothetical protein
MAYYTLMKGKIQASLTYMRKSGTITPGGNTKAPRKGGRTYERRMKKYVRTFKMGKYQE